MLLSELNDSCISGLTFCKHTFSLDYFFKIMFKNENKNETDSKTPHCKQEAVVFRMRKSLTLIRSRVVVRCAVLHNCRRQKRPHSEECPNHFCIRPAVFGWFSIIRTRLSFYGVIEKEKKLFPDIGKLEHILKLVSLHTTIT